MKPGRLLLAGLALAVAGALSWALAYSGVLGPPAALRLGGGLGAGVVLLTGLPGLWPGTARRSALDEALDLPPPARPPRPRSLRDVEVTLRLATSSQGGRDAYYRLRPLLRRLAERRLLVRHLVELDAQPGLARELLGADLWELVREGVAPPERAGRGVAVAKLASWVDKLESL